MRPAIQVPPFCPLIVLLASAAAPFFGANVSVGEFAMAAIELSFKNSLGFKSCIHESKRSYHQRTRY